MTKLILIRGIPGSGKSTYARKIVPELGLPMLEADMFFINKFGNYEFNPKLIKVAHEWCYSSTVNLLNQGYGVIVSNTFTQMWEMERYLKIPEMLPDVEIEVITMLTEYNNVHGVPEDKVEQMRNRFESIPADFPWKHIVVAGPGEAQ